MTHFKKDQLIICVQNSYKAHKDRINIVDGITKGKVYRVLDVTHSRIQVIIKNDYGMVDTYHISWFNNYFDIKLKDLLED